jgi:hypothetical protein
MVEVTAVSVSTCIAVPENVTEPAGEEFDALIITATVCELVAVPSLYQALVALTNDSVYSIN